MFLGEFFPNNYIFPDGSNYQGNIAGGENWLLIATNGENKFLIVDKDLMKFWTKSKLLPKNLFSYQKIAEKDLYFLALNKSFAVGEINSFQNYSKIDALAFAYAIKISRDFLPDAQFFQAIYLEQYCRILPIGEISYNLEKIENNDSYILGKYLSGEEIPADDFAKIKENIPKINKNDWLKICNTAGIKIKKNSEKKSKFRLVGRKKLEDFFNEHIIDIVFNSEKYKKVGIDYPSAIILHGLPGCGKTFAVEKLAEFLDFPIYRIEASSVASPYIHDSAKKIAETFDEAIKNAPSVLIIDEMEAYLSDRNSLNQQHNMEEIAEFLRKIPEATSKKVLIFAMTNLIEKIDPAILRRGRFDHIIEVEMPNQEEIFQLLKSEMKKRKHNSNIDFNKIANKLSGKAMSDISFIIREAAILSVFNGEGRIEEEHFEQAFSLLPKNRDKKSKIGFF